MPKTVVKKSDVTELPSINAHPTMAPMLRRRGVLKSKQAALATALPLSTDAGFRRRCREYAERRYSWERHVDALEAVLVEP